MSWRIASVSTLVWLKPIECEDCAHALAMRTRATEVSSAAQRFAANLRGLHPAEYQTCKLPTTLERNGPRQVERPS